MSDGSGAYAVGFSTAPEVRRHVPAGEPPRLRATTEVTHAHVPPLFLAAIEATEEGILDALRLAETLRGYRGRVMEALPHDVIGRLLAERGVATG